MKETYIKPLICIAELETEQIVCSSQEETVNYGGDGNGRPAQVRPFSDVMADDFSFLND